MRYCLFLLTYSLATAEWLDVGVKGGAVVTDTVTGTLHSESKRYIAGPMVEVRLPLHFSIEADALYRRTGFTGVAGSCCSQSITRGRANSWEFPVLAKYHLSLNAIKPFVGLGYSPRVVHGEEVTSGYFLSGMTQNPPGSVFTFFTQRADTKYPTTHGLVVSGGIHVDAGHLRLSPEIRYVRWNEPYLNQFGGSGSFQFTSGQNEVYVLLGLSWH